jgi:putative nucleotidyltransferase with HDIG domain
MIDYIRNTIQKISLLPTFPRVVTEVMDVIEDPKSSVSDIVKHMDPSVVSEVLKVANSAYFGKGNFRRIGTLEQAVAAIGYSGLSSIVLHMPFLSMIEGGDTLFDRTAFIRHSLSVAILAKAASSMFDLGSPDRVYISGMLHDIGIIIMYRYFKEEWQKIGSLMEQDRLGRLEAERSVLGADHAVLGSILLESWDLPETVTESVRLHHSRDEIGEKEEPYVTWLANNLAKQIESPSNLADFETFFKKQRDYLQGEMPERYLLKYHVELLEIAYAHLKEVEGFLLGTPEGTHD